MDSFGAGLAAARPVRVDVYTDAYRVSGHVQTRFSRVADILNQLTGGHLAVDQATLSEHDDPTGALGAPSALVSLNEILVMVADLEGAASPDMRVPKRPVRAQLLVPPLRVMGTIHVPMGSRPLDGLLNVPDRFMPMTDVELTSAAHPDLTRRASVVAVRRDRAHVLLVADDERPDELLADVIDESTAEAWLRTEAPPG